jgi:hypothetical protein
VIKLTRTDREKVVLVEEACCIPLVDYIPWSGWVRKSRDGKESGDENSEDDRDGK